MAKLFLVMSRSGQVCLVMHKDIGSMPKLWSFIPGYDLAAASFARQDNGMRDYAQVWPIHTYTYGYFMPSSVKLGPRYVQVC